MYIKANFVDGSVWKRDGVTEQEALNVYGALDLEEAIFIGFGDDYGPPITSIEVKTKDGRKKYFS